MHTLVSRLLTALTAFCLLLSLSAPAMAQDKGPFREPNINFKDEEEPYILWGAGLLVVLACLLVPCKNPHRTHLD